MGIVRMGPPADLILELKTISGISCFIETGTFKGETTSWSAQNFARVVTVEASKDIFDQAVKQLGRTGNIEFLHGDSKVVLSNIVKALNEPAIFWLDAHWSGLNTFGKGETCPILEEIMTINNSGKDHIILIDDARLFLSPPPRPHNAAHWPDIVQVIDALRKRTGSIYVAIMEDIIIATSDRYKTVVTDYCQDVNTANWEKNGSRIGNIFNAMIVMLGSRIKRAQGLLKKQ